jgi:hypothetical protein
VFTPTERKYYLLWLVAVLVSAFIAAPLTFKFISPGPTLADFFGFCHRFAGYFLTCLCAFVALVAVLIKLGGFRSAAVK